MAATNRYFPRINTFALPTALLDNTLTALRTEGEFCVESLVFWGGAVADGVAVVTHVFVPKGPGVYKHQLQVRINEQVIAALCGELDPPRLVLLGQVHTHMEAAFHSPSDDRFSLDTPGYVSIVIPEFARGNVSATLVLERQNGVGAVRLNEKVLADILKAADRAAELSGGTRPDTAALLSLKGVLEINDSAIEDPAHRTARERLLLQSLEATLDKLVESRRAEGTRLSAILADQLTQIEKLVAVVRASPSRSPEAMRGRLKDLVSRLMEASDTFDADRLAQEAVLAASRADIEEEIARLDAHVSAARDILDENAAVGRKLDFLAQEFNREANTLCSKANTVDVTRLGLALKTVIDQFREQVQNVE